MEKVLYEVEKNGYKMVMLKHENGMKDIILRQENHDNVSIYFKEEFERLEYIKNNEHSKIDFKIGTFSIGSQSIEGIERMVVKYQQAIETVKFFKEELLKLEKGSVE